jgi:hypothetical protein
MIFHASIPADEPERVARVMAEPWRGEYFPFLFSGFFIVLASDQRGTEVEIAPRRLELVPAATQVSLLPNPAPSPYNAVHLNIAIRVSPEEALAIGAHEGWTTRVCDRGGSFKVIEFWLENKFMLELMTEPELERYRKTLAPEYIRNLPQLPAPPSWNTP